MLLYDAMMKTLPVKLRVWANVGVLKSYHMRAWRGIWRMSVGVSEA